MRGPFFVVAALAAMFAAPLFAQDFGFGPVSDEEAGGGAPALVVSGSVSASMTAYVDDFSDGPDHVRLGDIFSGRLNFSARASVAEGFVALRLRPEAQPVALDEAYVRAWFGAFDVEAGLRKITWGKADSFGPLDVINLPDTAELYKEMADADDLMDVKIARPLVHASLRFGGSSKLEGVFVPNFMPYDLAAGGRWTSTQAGPLALASAPDTSTLDYAQGGLRFTATVGSADLGVQYYYGRLPQPALKIGMDPSATPPVSMELLYNPYHQAGLDYAQVVFGFNIRAELAANITEDIAGDDGSVYNPAIAWSLGFDRDLFFGINLNVQVNESVRLMNDQVGGTGLMGGNFDIEGGTDLSATRMMATLSKKFFRDTLELRAAAAWGIEDGDFIIMPALIWTRDDLKIACSGGIFGGNHEGQLGQFYKNSFVKVAAVYTF
jgi:hypothetical protein